MVRATMWREALAAHEAGRIRATEVRASDFIGPTQQSFVTQRVIPRVLRHTSVQVLGSADALHSWTYTDDVARTLVACAQSPAAWGSAWHASTNAPRTQRQVVDDIAGIAGVERVRVSVVPVVALRVRGLFNPLIRELPKILYQFSAPFIIDDTATRRELALPPTPWEEVLRDTIAATKVLSALMSEISLR